MSALYNINDRITSESEAAGGIITGKGNPITRG
jgi:hypothetical protein